MTIGIYGGSFNPIHEGHTTLGRALCQTGRVDELWYVVSPQNPLKQADGLLADEARLTLARLAIGDDPWLRVCDIEMHLPRPSYMADTLARLRQEWPQHEFVLVLGADNWLRFSRWSRPEEILAHHRVLVYPRPGCPVEAATLPPGVELLDTPLLDISATQLRQSIRQGTCRGEHLAPAVWQEIVKEKHYR